MLKRRIACLFLAMSLLLPMVLTGCSNTTSTARKTQAYTGEFDNTVRVGYGEYNGVWLAGNDKFDLYWFDDAQSAFIHDRANNVYFGTVPYDFFANGEDNEVAYYELYNPIKVSCLQNDAERGITTIVDLNASSDCIDYGNIVSELLENGKGIRVTYYFDMEQVAVTLELELTSRGLEARIPLERIQENESHVYEISLLPYMASAALSADGSAAEDSYFMVPSGGGALIDLNMSRNEKVDYSEAIYGGDKSEPVTMNKTMYDQSYLPIFGVKNGSTGMLGIIGEGAACAYVNASTGDSEVGYAPIYASFRIRGKESIMYSNAGMNSSKATLVYSEDIANYEYLSVEYIPLVEDASYLGMANAYRQALIEDGYLQTPVAEVPALSVNFLGATRTPESFFGIPYDSDTATTTIKQTQTITSDLKDLVGDKKLLVNMVGYGEGGLANYTVGGNFKLSGKVGSQKDLKNYLTYAKNNNVLVSMNYQSGSTGFAVNDAAYNISGLKISFGTYDLSTTIQDEEGDFWYLLSRGKLAKALQKALKANKKMGFEAISLGSLNSVAYSDYRKGEYAAKSQIESNVADMLKQCADNGYKTIASEANLYAALNADYVTEVPMSSSKYSVLSCEIPMYSLVFQGYKSLSSSSINLAVDAQKTYLKAVATGMTLQYTLCDTFHDSIQFDNDTAYISSQYSDWKKDIETMYTKNTYALDSRVEIADSEYSYQDLHAKVGDQAIAYYEEVDGVSTTVFANGVTVYVNYTNEPVQSPAGEIPALSFVYQ